MPPASDHDEFLPPAAEEPTAFGGFANAHDEANLAEPLHWIVSELVPAGSQILIAGSGKIGKKTLLSQHLAKCVSRGVPFLGFKTEKRPVLYIHLEGGRKRARRRWQSFGYAQDSTSMSELDRNAVGLGYDILAYDAALQALRTSPVLVVVDSVIRVTAHKGLDENNPADVTTFLAENEALLDLGPGASILFIHHFRKARDAIRGSTAWENGPDGWWESHATDDPDVVRLEVTLRDGRSHVVGARFIIEPDGTFAFEAVEDVPGRKIDSRPSAGSRRNGNGAESNGKSHLPDEAALIDRIREVLHSQDDFVGIKKIAAFARVSWRKLDGPLETLAVRGEIDRGAYGGYRATEKLRGLMTNRRRTLDDVPVME